MLVVLGQGRLVHTQREVLITTATTWSSSSHWPSLVLVLGVYQSLAEFSRMGPQYLPMFLAISPGVDVHLVPMRTENLGRMKCVWALSGFLPSASLPSSLLLSLHLLLKAFHPSYLWFFLTLSLSASGGLPLLQGRGCALRPGRLPGRS